MFQYQVGILTIENDLHALAIQQAFGDYHDVICHIIETDLHSDSSGLNWSNMNDPDLRCSIPTKDGKLLDVSQLDVIWWRRTNFPQKIPPEVTDPIHIDLINNECRATLIGLLSNEFSGSWVSDPAATRMAENKLVQLRAAQQAGFYIPRTLVSQDPTKIRLFCARLQNRVVVKPVRGTRQFHLFTRMLSEEHLASDDSLRLCPAMYQEFIPGTFHIRAHCFGDAVYAVLIESEGLDWRENLNVPFRVFDLDEDVKKRLSHVLRILGLKMGIFDLKHIQGTSPVWLEINPQGQFLFAEGLTGLDLTSAFANFLYQEAKNVKGYVES